MGTSLAELRRRIREEMRAEGPDGAGYSDFFLDQQINTAISVLASTYPIRDSYTFLTVAGQDEYDLDTVLDDSDVDVDKIIKLTLDGVEVQGSRFEDHYDRYYLDGEYYSTTVDTGEVYGWTLWGRKIILYVNDITELAAGEEVEIWVTRAPLKLVDDEDESELPAYADEAISQFAITACYRESRDYQRATLHYQNFLHHEERLRKRDIPQGQRAYPSMMSSIYSNPVRTQNGNDFWSRIL